MSTINFVAVPGCLEHLAAEPRWVGWSWEERQTKAGDTKWTKPPKTVHGGLPNGYAKNDDPTTWATLAEARAAFDAGHVKGVGLQLLDLMQFAAIDLDDVRLITSGALLPWVADIIARSGSYAELTPSGTGVRILGMVPAGFDRLHIGKQRHPKGGAFEIYSQTPTGRYVTVSGARLPGSPDQLGDISELIIELRKQIGNLNGFEFDAGTPSWEELPEWLRTAISHGLTGDRSADFQSAVNGLVARGIRFETALRWFDEHPNGPAAKYVNRLEAELRRSWDKAKGSGSSEGADSFEGPTGKEEGGADTAGSTSDAKAATEEIEPFDLWGRLDPPELPAGLLPPVIEEFAFSLGSQLGADPAGLAMAALCTSCAAISDRIMVRVQQHGGWFEAARIWAMLVGLPSTKKTPILWEADKPIRQIDLRLFHDYVRQLTEYDSLPKKDKAAAVRPKQVRKRLDDTTVEAAADVLVNSPDGVLLMQDELSGFFGGMNRYCSNGKGSDRAFWLQAFNGGAYAVNRIGRGASMVPNLSACILGAIQPGPLREVAAGSADDGLIQRFLPIVLRPATIGVDDMQSSEAARAYGDLIVQLTNVELPAIGFMDISARPHLVFEDSAHEVRRQLQQKHHDLVVAVETFNRKLAAHVGKLDGIFARLCVAFHCVEHAAGGLLPQVISEDVARRVAKFMQRFLLPHALSLYSGVLDLSDDHDRLIDMAGYILAHRLEKVSVRDVAQGSPTMRRLTRLDVMQLMEQLEAFGWVRPQPTPARLNASPTWIVSPRVHQLFDERAVAEAERRRKGREIIQEVVSRNG